MQGLALSRAIAPTWSCPSYSSCAASLSWPALDSWSSTSTTLIEPLGIVSRWTTPKKVSVILPSSASSFGSALFQAAPSMNVTCKTFARSLSRWILQQAPKAEKKTCTDVAQVPEFESSRPKGNALLHRLGKKHPRDASLQKLPCCCMLLQESMQTIYCSEDCLADNALPRQEGKQKLLTNESTFGWSHADVHRPLAFHEPSENLDSRMSQGNCCQNLKLGLKPLPYESQGVSADLQPLFCRRRHGAD